MTTTDATLITTPRTRWRSRCLRAAAAAVVVWLLASWVVAYGLTRRRHARAAEVLPAGLEHVYESTRLHSRDGQDLGAWYAEGRGEASMPAVIVLHGNGGRRWNCLDRAELLREAGCPVLLVSLRAHGDSSGDFNDVGYSARLDVAAAVEYLEHRRPGRPVVVLGTSLGGAAALFAAEELGPRVRGYIVESPYRDLRTAVWNRLENALPPVLDWVAYRGLLAVAPVVLPHLDQISPCDAAGRVPADVPVLILAGANDRRARPEEARAVFERVRSHGELVVFPNADHLQMIHEGPARYRRAVLGFMEAASPHAPAAGAAPFPSRDRPGKGS